VVGKTGKARKGSGRTAPRKKEGGRERGGSRDEKTRLPWFIKRTRTEVPSNYWEKDAPELENYKKKKGGKE